MSEWRIEDESPNDSRSLAYIHGMLIPTSTARDTGWYTQYALWWHVGEGRSVQLAAGPVVAVVPAPRSE